MQTSSLPLEPLHDLLAEFNVTAPLVSIEAWKGGHINQTLLVTVHECGVRKRYVLQRVNSKVFTHPEGLMDNAMRVSEHAVSKLLHDPHTSKDDLLRGAIRFLRTRSGKSFIPHDSGDVWRLYPCIEESQAHLTADSTDKAYEAAKAFGNFQRLLSDLPGGRLFETIPNFHNTPWRFGQLEKAIRADAKQRAVSVQREIDAYMARRPRAGILQHEFAAGAFPERTVHNDAKLSNVLLDAKTHAAVCVIDLDTTMTGFALHDFGDLVRSICNPADESEQDLTKVGVRLDYFEALVTGYLEAAKDMLTPREIELLPDAGWVIALETGVRFLTDYLNGDIYFRISFPEQNKVRALVQLSLAQHIEDAMPEMRRIVKERS